MDRGVVDGYVPSKFGSNLLSEKSDFTDQKRRTTEAVAMALTLPAQSSKAKMGMLT